MTLNCDRTEPQRPAGPGPGPGPAGELTCPAGAPRAAPELRVGGGGLFEPAPVHVGGSVGAAERLLLLTHAHLLLLLSSCGTRVRLAPQPGPAQTVDPVPGPRVARLALQVPALLAAAAGVQNQAGPAAAGLRTQVRFARTAAGTGSVQEPVRSRPAGEQVQNQENQNLHVES